MAAYLDRISLKHSNDTKSILLSSLSTGGTDALRSGELVLGTLAGQEGLYFINNSGQVFDVTSISTKSIDALSDVDTVTTPPTSNQVLRWNSTLNRWVPGPAISNLREVANVSTSAAPLSGTALIYDRGKWIEGPRIASVTYPNPGDPDFSFVASLFKFNEDNNATVIYDSANANASGVSSLGAVVTSSEGKFGNSGAFTGLSAGTRKQFRISNASYLNMGSGDFTVEFWIKIIGSGLSQIFLRNESATNWQRGWGISIDTATGVNFIRTGYFFYQAVSMGTGAFPTGSWVHVAIQRQSGNISAFVNGVRGSYNNNLPAMDPPNIDGTAYFGVSSFDPAGQYDYYLDEFRFTKGKIRYTANFTPTSLEFPTSIQSVPVSNYSINRLHDVDTESNPPSEGQALTWNTATNQWVPSLIKRVTTDAAPNTFNSTGTAGEVRFDSDYVYICVATNTWKRASIASW